MVDPEEPLEHLVTRIEGVLKDSSLMVQDIWVVAADVIKVGTEEKYYVGHTFICKCS